MTMKARRILISACAAFLALSSSAWAGATLDGIRLRGSVICGVSTGSMGFSSESVDGAWSGLDVDFCRAVAAATLGDAGKVRFVPLDVNESFESLTLGEIDVLARSVTWTYSRDTSKGVVFVGVSYFDSQGFLVKKERDVTTLEDMKDARVCFVRDTTNEANLKEAFAARGVAFTPVPLDSEELLLVSFQSGRCDVVTADKSTLHGQRQDLRKPDAVTIPPLAISKEPLGPAVRQGDEQWHAAVRWVLFALINAEEAGVTSTNLAEMMRSADPTVAALLRGVGGANVLGLSPGWVADVIRQTGNYGEIFSRNVGEQSRLGIERGLNALWSKGGLMFAPPFR